MFGANLKNRKGFTLIEIIIALSLLIIVLGLVLSLLVTSNRFFFISSDQYDIQNKLRVVTKDITNKVRYATDIEIMSTMDSSLISSPSSIGAYDKYIYFDDTTETTMGYIVELDRYGSKKYPIGTPGSGTAVLFSSVSPLKSLAISISSSYKNRDYNISADILSLNVNLNTSNVITGATTAGGTAIKYKTLTGFISETQRPNATIGTGNGKKILDVTFNRNLAASGTSIIDQGTTDTTRYGTLTQGTDSIELNFTKNVEVGRTLLLHIKFWDDTEYDYNVTYTDDDWYIDS